MKAINEKKRDNFLVVVLFNAEMEPIFNNNILETSTKRRPIICFSYHLAPNKKKKKTKIFQQIILKMIIIVETTKSIIINDLKILFSFLVFLWFNFSLNEARLWLLKEPEIT